MALVICRCDLLQRNVSSTWLFDLLDTQEVLIARATEYVSTCILKWLLAFSADIYLRWMNPLNSLDSQAGSYTCNTVGVNLVKRASVEHTTLCGRTLKC
jgi:hypothetical protein